MVGPIDDHDTQLQLESFNDRGKMVLKIGGWAFSFEQVRTWLEKQGQQYQHLQDEYLSGDLNFWFKERNIDYMWAIPTDYPRGSCQPVIVLARRQREDPKSTVVHFSRFMELDADRDVKKQVMEESGLNDEDLPWITIADPYFKC
ncbi:hypothetical protein DEU56DRAFT_815993 [Suillus clintonianus]|uniref:uncharacterized protein n=1 Tax=Suillus clintonianus TaxID=1904413 RepID=UPI001B861744|nr:uncharacterized protein DEU56DRAFT_815993 [Suillus clintonianus]KAG2130260.1 hypothetical protein DEU56DRAFT_815993 [Suillus clintonianus]